MADQETESVRLDVPGMSVEQQAQWKRDTQREAIASAYDAGYAAGAALQDSRCNYCQGQGCRHCSALHATAAIWDLPPWCSCPDDCDCAGDLVCVVCYRLGKPHRQGQEDHADLDEALAAKRRVRQVGCDCGLRPAHLHDEDDNPVTLDSPHAVPYPPAHTDAGGRDE